MLMSWVASTSARWARSLRALAALGLVLAAGGCVNAIGSQFDVPYDPAAQAVVVIGVAPEDFPVPATLAVGWAGYDRTTGEVSRAAVFHWLYSVNPFDRAGSAETQHVVFVVEPGDYILTHANVAEANYVGGAVNALLFRGLAPYLAQSDRSTGFAVDRASQGGFFTAPRLAANTAAPRARLAAGEIVYVGVHRFDFRANPMRLLGMARDDEGARAALLRYPFGGGAMTFRATRTGDRDPP